MKNLKPCEKTVQGNATDTGMGKIYKKKILKNNLKMLYVARKKSKRYRGKINNNVKLKNSVES